MKFKPGLTVNYMSRWIQMTKKVFRYYRNFYHSASSFTKPLVAIPWEAIKEVKKVQITVQPHSNEETNANEASLHSHQFEIVLKNDYECIHFIDRVSRIYNSYSERKDKKIREELLSVLGTPQKIKEDLSEDSEGDKEGFVSPRPSNPFLRKSRVEPSGFSKSILSYSTNSCTPHRRSEPMFKQSEIRFNTPQRPHSNLNNLQEGFMAPKITRVVEGHLMPIRDTSRHRLETNFLEHASLMEKKFGEDMHDSDFNLEHIRPTNSWSKREIDWFNAERRFIFACSSDQERSFWIKNIKKLCK